MDMFEDVLDFLKERLWLVILGVILCIGGFMALKIYNNYTDSQTAKSPIVSLEATCKKVYKVDGTIKKSDITVKTVHENGGKLRLSSDDFEISQENLNPVGQYTTIIVTYNADNNITTSLDVEVEREKVMGFTCGYPSVNNVTAVLYSNGELRFEGEGDVLISKSGQFLWSKYDDMKENPIKSVSFEESVRPTNMNYWFLNQKNLVYVDPIPSSVITMKQTFTNCTSLTAMPDLSNATSLLDMSECFSGCSTLIDTVPIPASVNNLTKAFYDCDELINTPNLENAASLVDMTSAFAECNKLSGVEVGPNVVSLVSTFTNCINLKEIATIPSSVTDMTGTFSGCTSLTTVCDIPSSVTKMASTFANCQLLSYQIIINANPVDYSNCFSGAALATSLNLAGSSKMLDVLANTSSSINITVFGEKPNENLTKRSDVIVEE